MKSMHSPLTCSALIALLAASAVGQSTSRVSVASGGTQATNSSACWMSSLSSDGRYVAFQTAAANLVPGDTNLVVDVLVRDRMNGTTERVSVSSAGVQGNNQSVCPAISADGRYVAFWGSSTNLVLADTNASYDVFVRDQQAGTTERVSLSSAGVQGDGASSGQAISADGRFVVFFSTATNLVPGVRTTSRTSSFVIA